MEGVTWIVQFVWTSNELMKLRFMSTWRHVPRHVFVCAWMFAARKNVEMERARYELEEHRRVCISTIKEFGFTPERGVSTDFK